MSIRDEDIAVVGLACRYPGASTPEAYWDLLREGREAIRNLSDDELRARGVSEADLRDPRYVKRGASLDGVAGFDAGFFGFSALEASLLDPQHRHFLECSWEALERAGHVPSRFDGRIGVFAGNGMQTYFATHLLPNARVMEDHGLFLVRHTGNDKDFLATRVAYEFDLRGPAITVQSACSTSLVAVHMAAQSLLAFECDMALAGGVSIDLPYGVGYHYEPGGVASPDGRCRAFDARAEGTLFGAGCGVVALRRLADAIEDGDVVHAVIRGSAVNNDGRSKVGYLAPSVDGHATVVAEAIEVADLRADDLHYIEAHGTGTPVGDPIEVAALTQAFRVHSDAIGVCGLGSVKPNVGHLDTAAGVSSLQKVVLALQHGELPPTLHFTAPHPSLQLGETPFRVIAEREAWTDAPRRAGVSSIGVGGTNAHVVLEQAPPRTPRASREETCLLALSAKSPEALRDQMIRLSQALRNIDALHADVAYTLDVGREAWPYRACVASSTLTRAAERWSDPLPVTRAAPRKLVFAFAGGGAQRSGMGAELYESEGVFAKHLDDALDALAELADPRPVRAALLDPAFEGSESPEVALPALFAMQVACARWLIDQGAAPEGLVGHSMGEYTAAHLAGVLTLRDAMRVVAARGRLFAELDEGAMIAVTASAERLRPYASAHDCDVAADNAPELALASGAADAIDALAKALDDADIAWRRVPIRVAAHSRALDPILPAFAEVLGNVTFGEPTLPVLSNRSADWAGSELRTPAYWVDHLRHEVRFREGVERLLGDQDALLLEIGPGRTLTTLARASSAFDAERHVVGTSTPQSIDPPRSSREALWDALGLAWSAGTREAVQPSRDDEGALRVTLPSYAWQHADHWIERAPANERQRERFEDPSGELRAFVPVWRPSASVARPTEGATVLFAFGEGAHSADDLAGALRADHPGERVVVVGVREQAETRRTARFAWTADPDDAAFADLPARLRAAHGPVASWVYLVAADEEARAFDATYRLARVAASGSEEQRWLWLCDDAFGSAARADAALLTGLASVLPSECPDIEARVVDVQGASLEACVREIRATSADVLVALRGRSRLARRFEPCAAALTPELLVRPSSGRNPDETDRRASARPIASEPSGSEQSAAEPRTHGPSDHAHCAAPFGGLPRGDDLAVTLITGGLGGIGLAVARALARPGRRLALLGREALPPRQEWPAWDASRSERVYARIAAVEAIEAQGARVRVVGADVRDRATLDAALRDIEATLGPIREVVHAAGVLEDALLPQKDAASVARVLGPKVDGARALWDALSERADSALDAWTSFSSQSAYLGLPGQSDYAAANAWLDAHASELARRGVRSLSIAWPAWRDTGMAASRAAWLRGEGGTPAAYASLGRCVERSAAQRTYRAAWTSDAWVLDEHRFVGGSAVLPGAAMLALAHAAALDGVLASGDAAPHALRMSDVSFLDVFAVGDDETRALELAVDQSRWSLRSEEGVIARGRYDAPGAPPEGAEIAHAISGRREERVGAPEDPHVAFGAHWGCVRAIVWGDDSRSAELELAWGDDADPAWSLPPAALDMALAGAQALAYGSRRDESAGFWVPIGLDDATFFASQPAAGLRARVRYVTPAGASGDLARFDIDGVDDAGRPVFVVRGFAMRRVDDATRFRTSTLRASAQSSASRTLEDALSRGIDASEGVAAFLALRDAAPGSHVVLSRETPRDPAREARAEAAPIDAAVGERLSATEAAVATIWAHALGGTIQSSDDDFFALGGHSLSAMRVIAKVNDRFGVDLPLRAIFEHANIAALAAEIDARAQAAQPAGGQSAVALGARAGASQTGDTGSAGEATPSAGASSASADSAASDARGPTRHAGLGPHPLTPAQRGLWFLEQSTPGNAAYHIGAAWTLPRLDAATIEALEAALRSVLKRHETLRTRFVVDAGEPVAYVAPMPERVLEECAPVESAQRFANETAAAPFDLERGALFRARLAACPEGVVLAFAVHHIVADEWSLEVLASEVNALMSGETLAPLDVQFSDVARWLEGVEASDALAAWSDSLAGQSFALDVPTDRPRPAIASSAGARHVHSYSRASADAARAFCQAEGVTLFVTLMAAYQAFVSRWSGSDDVVVATPSSLRSLPELQGMVGFFVNTVLLRAELDDRPSFRTLVSRTRAQCLDAFDRQAVPFDALVQHLRIPRDASRHPLYQTMFALFPVERGLTLEGARALHVDPGGAQVDLTIYMADEGGELTGIAEYATALFDEATIAHTQERFELFLNALLADPDAPIANAACVTASERHALLTALQGPTQRVSEDAHFVRRFEKQRARRGDHVALESGEVAWTYRELDQRANAVARWLRRSGVDAGDVVGVCAERDAWLVPTLLGVWKIGATYVPLDPEFPVARLRWMLADSGAKALVTTGATAETTGTLHARTLLRDEADLKPTRKASATLSLSDTAYILYTSGSTGRPKGVRISQASVANFLHAMASRPGLREGDRLYAITTISFDISVLELYGPLWVGGTVVLAEDARDGERLGDALRERSISVMQATPATWRLLVQSGWEGQPLRALCGGEALPPDLAGALAPITAALWNLYGPTETTVWSTAAEIRDEDAPISIGTPIGNTRVYVLDAGGGLCGAGMPGELAIGGAGVAEGYHGRPALTSERFVDDPFVDPTREAPRPRMYLTGDRVVRHRDGTLRYLERMDAQVKVRGYRIELGEVEAALRGLAGVRDAAARTLTFGPGDVRLVGYVVADAFEPADARRALQETLPSYMIPGVWETLETLPQTPNGKVDRKALPLPGARDAAELVPPRTTNERFLAAAWSDAIGAEVGAQDNFFDIGGHSLLAMRVIAHIEEHTGHRFNPLELSMQTLAQLAAALPAAPELPSATASAPTTPPREPAEREVDAQKPTSPRPAAGRRGLRGALRGLKRFIDGDE